MAIDFSAQFERKPDDVVYKGVHLQNTGRRTQSKNPNTREYKFVSWFTHPTTGKFIDQEITGTLSNTKREVNELFGRGYKAEPNGHMRTPDQEAQ